MGDSNCYIQTRRIVLSILIGYILFSLFSFFIQGKINTYFLLISLALSSFYFINYKKLITILCLTVFIIEIGLHIFSPYKTYAEKNGNSTNYAPYFNHPKPAPYASGLVKKNFNSEFKITHTYNHLGLRDSYTTQTHYKAIILGDSFVEGVGVDSSFTIDKNLEKLLDCDNCMLNAGLAGSELINSFEILKELNIKNTTSDTVLLNLNSTDIIDIVLHAESHNIDKFTRPSLLFQFIYNISFIFRHVIHDIVNLNGNLLTEKQETNNFNQSKTIIENTIVELNEYCKSQNTSFIVSFQPTFYEYKDLNFELDGVYENVKKRGINAVNLNTVFEKDHENYFWPIDLHFNQKGYVLYSQELYKQVF